MKNTKDKEENQRFKKKHSPWGLVGGMLYGVFAGMIIPIYFQEGWQPTIIFMLFIALYLLIDFGEYSYNKKTQ